MEENQTQQPTLSREEKNRQDFRAWMAGRSGYIGKKRKANWWANRGREDKLSDNMTQYGEEVPLTGSIGEKEKAMQALMISKLAYGQGLGQTGKDIQDLKSSLQARRSQSGADPVTQLLRSQKAGAIANAQRQLASQNIRGPASLGAIESIRRQSDASIGASAYGQSRQSDIDFGKLIGGMLSGSVGLMYQGQAGGVSDPKQPKDSKFLGIFS